MSPPSVDWVQGWLPKAPENSQEAISLLTARVPLSSSLLSSADLCQGHEEAADLPGSWLRFDVCFLWAPGLITEGCPEEVCQPHPESLD